MGRAVLMEVELFTIAAILCAAFGGQLWATVTLGVLALLGCVCEGGRLMRDVFYCEDCGGRLDLYVGEVWTRRNFDLTGEDAERDEREARERLTSESEGE